MLSSASEWLLPLLFFTRRSFLQGMHDPQGSDGSASDSQNWSRARGGKMRKRVLDDEGFIRRAACVCVNEEETRVALVSSKRDSTIWVIPGGGLEDGEDPLSAARREVWEEAGIEGTVARYLGLFESHTHKNNKKHRTAVYVVIVTREDANFPEARIGRRRKWFSIEDALGHLSRHRPSQSSYLKMLKKPRLKLT